MDGDDTHSSERPATRVSPLVQIFRNPHCNDPDGVYRATMRFSTFPARPSWPKAGLNVRARTENKGFT